LNREIETIKKCLSSVTSEELRDINWYTYYDDMTLDRQTPNTPPNEEEMHPLMKGTEYSRTQ